MHLCVLTRFPIGARTRTTDKNKVEPLRFTEPRGPDASPSGGPQHAAHASRIAVSPGRRPAPALPDSPPVRPRHAPSRRFCVALAEDGDSAGIALLALRPVSVSLRIRCRSAGADGHSEISRLYPKRAGGNLIQKRTTLLNDFLLQQSRAKRALCTPGQFNRRPLGFHLDFAVAK